MKALLCLLVASCLAVSLRAQAPSSEYAPEQLDQMLGPIALYPDPLVALILPASTFPAQITQAAQFVAGNAKQGLNSWPRLGYAGRVRHPASRIAISSNFTPSTRCLT